MARKNVQLQRERLGEETVLILLGRQAFDLFRDDLPVQQVETISEVRAVMEYERSAPYSFRQRFKEIGVRFQIYRVNVSDDTTSRPRA